MVKITKPMIIKLKENLHTAAEAVVTTDTAHHAGTNKTADIPSAQGHQMMGSLMDDEEMENDFKWLVDFDLRSVFLEDIDGGGCENGKPELLQTGPKRSLGPGKVEKIKKSRQLTGRKSTRSIPFTYSELIKFCLTEKGDSSVKEIYDWISQRFSSLKPSDISWKNAIRHTLSVSPQFEKRKGYGKCHFWYLRQDIYHNNTNPQAKDKGGNIETSGYRNGKNKDKFILSDVINEGYETSDTVETSDFDISTKWYTIESENNMSDSIVRCAEAITALKNESSEYYELEIPINPEVTTESTNYTEPLEVRYLIDETAASIPVHIF